MRYLRLFAAVIAVVGVAATTGVAKDRVVVRQGFAYKPHELTISGDGDFWVQNLRWHSWGGGKAVASGTAVEQERPSHDNYDYPARVTLSDRTYCANLHRTVYRKIVARITGPSPGMFGGRTLGMLWTCAGSWRLIS